MLTSMALGRATTGETDIIWDRNVYPGRSTKSVIFFHGSGDTATTVYTKPDFQNLCRLIAYSHRTLAADFGGQTFGNDTAITRGHEAVTWLQANGSTGTVGIVAASMGMANALAYTLAHPENVACVAGIIPLLDLASIIPLGYGDDLDAAYPPTYDDGIDGPAHSPIHFAASLPVDLPIGLWTSSNDDLALPATATAYVAARPQTERTDLGALGHTGTAVTAAAAGVAAFLAANL